MRVLAVHPGPLMYTKIVLRLAPLGIELIAASARRAGHDVRLIDLQVEATANYLRTVRQWGPDVIAISNNYLANVPEVIELARAAKAIRPGAFVLVGGHSASFVAEDVIGHAEGAIDCVLKGEGETSLPRMLEPAAGGDPRGLLAMSG